MEHIKLSINPIRMILGLGILLLLYYSLTYRPVTYPSIYRAPADSPYLSPEGWPLPYPPNSFK